MMASARPSIAFGTMLNPQKEPAETAEDVYKATLCALKSGYRCIDSAEVYTTQEAVGRAIVDSNVPREELFLVSKIKGLPSGPYEAVLQRTKQILGKLQVSYLDAFLIHYPGLESLDFDAAPSDSDNSMEVFQAHIKEAWQNMMKLKEEGVVRQIGVSNFYTTHLASLKNLFPEQPPFINQIYIDLTHQEEDFVKQMQADGIHVMAYRPVTFSMVYPMLEDVNQALTAAQAESNTSSVQQLALSWLRSRGVCPVVKSTDSGRIAENFAATASVNGDSLKGIDGNEMVDMYGGCDEYAAMFKRVGSA